VTMLRLLLPCLLFSAACSTPTKPAAQTTPTAPKPPRITHFYSNANPVAPGQSATLCYGTDDATEVTLAPYDDTLKPSMNRCISVTPTRPTTYTLTAKGPGGQTTSTLSLALGAPTPSAPASPASPLITSFQSIGGGVVPPANPSSSATPPVRKPSPSPSPRPPSVPSGPAKTSASPPPPIKPPPIS